jgi:hypothetical protein
MVESSHNGWVIEKDFDWGRSYLGIYYFYGWCKAESLTMMGNRTMVFRTRAQARLAKSRTHSLKGRGSRIKRVTIQISNGER